MGVMSCSRKGCENIMCDTYVSGVGYICQECIQQFKEYLEKKGLCPKTEDEITKELEIFISTNKNTYDNGGTEISVDEFFKIRTR